MKQYLTPDALIDLTTSPTELFAAITEDNVGVGMSRDDFWNINEMLKHERIIFKHPYADILDIQAAGMICGETDSYLSNAVSVTNGNTLYFMASRIWNMSTVGYIVRYHLINAEVIVSLQRRKVIDDILASGI